MLTYLILYLWGNIKSAQAKTKELTEIVYWEIKKKTPDFMPQVATTGAGICETK